MLHIDPTSPAGLLDTAFHAAPALAPVFAFVSLTVAWLRDRIGG